MKHAIQIVLLYQAMTAVERRWPGAKVVQYIDRMSILHEGTEVRTAPTLATLVDLINSEESTSGS